MSDRFLFDEESESSAVRSHRDFFFIFFFGGGVGFVQGSKKKVTRQHKDMKKYIYV